jgi:hypothetical protein
MIHVLRTSKLVQDLARDRVSTRDKAYYLLAGFLFYIAIGYSTLTFANSGRNWLGLYECCLVLVITILGIQRCYEAGGGDENKQFVVDFTCLSLPVSIKVNIAVWGLYWLFAFAYRRMPDVLSDPSEHTREAIWFLSQHVGWFVILLAVLAV